MPEENKTVELKDEELEKVSGGVSFDYDCLYDNPNSIVYKRHHGDHVEVVRAYAFGHVFTQGCTVVGLNFVIENGKYIPAYIVSSSNPDYDGACVPEYQIEGLFLDIHQF